MFYISNINDWLNEVVQKCNKKGLDPLRGTFMFVFFSSLNHEYVRYFRENHEQISSVAGDDFYVLTPTVFNNNVIPDQELRTLKLDFRNAGIPVTNRPNLLFFYLSESGSGYRPVFFAGFETPELNTLENAFEDIVDITLDSISDNNNFDAPSEFVKLIPKFSESLKTRNYVDRPISPDIELVEEIENRLPKQKVFISHSSEDKPFVRRIMKALSTKQISSWLDEQEILPGDNIRKKVSEGIKESSALLLIISPNSIKSDWVKFEIAQFVTRKENRKIVPVLIGAKVNELPFPFREIQDLLYIDFTNESNWEENVSKLSKALQ